VDSLTIENSNILIADDEPANVLLLERLLQKSGLSQIRSVTDSRDILRQFDAFEPDILLLDVQMPYLDGFDILNLLADQLDPETYFPVLVLTADSSAATKRQALASGAKDFLTKPFDAVEVVLRVKNLLQMRALHTQLREHNRTLEEQVRARTADLEEAQVDVLERLGLVTEYRDDDTGSHIRRVGDLAWRVALQLGVSPRDAEMIRLAAPLHDLGKVAIPDEILLKPGRLTEAEFEIVKRHTEVGTRILSGSRSRLLQLAEEIAATHHERWDGAGYPGGLAHDEIPLSGRIIAVVDVFDALTSRRPYKTAWPEDRALAEIERLSGAHFDPEVVRAFRSALHALREEARLPVAA